MVIKVKSLLVLSVVLLCSYSVSVHASTISSVGGADVKKGKVSTGLRFGYSQDDEGSSQDNRLRSRVHVDYGLTDYYAARLVFSVDKRNADGIEADTLGIENRFHLLKSEEHGFDLGLRLNYSHKDGDKKPDTASVRVYQQVPINKWTIRFNEIFNHEVGEDSTGGIAFEMRSQAVYKVSDNLRVGLESFNDFGKLNEVSGYSAQEHEIGPVLKGKLGNGIGYEVGYRAGISDAAANHNMKLFFSKSF